MVLRFSNVSAHHCQLTVNGGYWYVRDLKSRNGVKVNGVRVMEKRVDPSDVISIAKHKYELKYSPAELGAVGPPPPDEGEANILGTSLLERAGLDRKRISQSESKPDPTEQKSYEISDDVPDERLFGRRRR